MRTLVEIGARLAAARQAAGLTVRELAGLSGLHRNTIVNLETGKGNLSLNSLLALASVLNLDLLVVPREVATSRATDDDLKKTELSEQLDGLMGKKT